MPLSPIVAVLPDLVRLADVVANVVRDVRSNADRAVAGADLEPVTAAVVRADDVLADVVAEAEVLAVREGTARNKLRYALDHARDEEKRARDAARTLDRGNRDDPAAVAHMATALSRQRDAESLAAELAEAEAHVEQVRDFLDMARAHREDVNRTVAMLRRRHARAERLAALTRLAGQLRERMDGVARLTEQVDDFRAEAEAAWEAAGRHPDNARILSHGRLRRGEAAEELARLRDEER